MARQPRHTLAARVLARLDQLATVTSAQGAVSRLYLSPEHKAAARLVSAWMQEAGLKVGIDATGTVVGRLEGSARSAKTLLLGSHIDSVVNAGRFDGCLGVVVAIEAAAELRRLGRKLPYALEVLAFGDEEGVRFTKTMSGSRALAGTIAPETLAIVDAHGTSLSEALRAFGCNPDEIPGLARRPADLLGYIEVHIEQGSVLEAESHSVGVATAISGAGRYLVEVRGKAGHAATLPMPMRRDALTGAAQMILAVEAIARQTPGLIATAGQIAVLSCAMGTVPAVAQFMVDLRSPVDRTRRIAFHEIQKQFRDIAKQRQLNVRVHETLGEKAAACDQRFIRHLTEAVELVSGSAIGLPCGDGHDASSLAKLCPIGMLLVRCKGGVTHHPDESVKAEDVEVATRVLLQFLQRIAPDGRTLS